MTDLDINEREYPSRHDCSLDARIAGPRSGALLRRLGHVVPSGALFQDATEAAVARAAHRYGFDSGLD